MASHSLFSFHLPKPSPLHLRASSAATVQSPPQSLEERFGRKGIKFSESGDVPTVELTVRNMSSLKLRIPDGIVTSYKPKVYWKDDGFEEVFYTIEDGDLSVKGGLGLVLNGVLRDGSAWSASEWFVKDADSDSIDAVQVELSCTNVYSSLDITYVVSLYPLSMATAVIVQNNGTESVKLTSGMLGHIRFKSPEGSAIQGLKGCSYCSHPPLASSFGLLSPFDEVEPDPPGWFSFLDSPSQEKLSTEIYEPEAWKVEDNLYTILKPKFSRVYAAPPRERTKRIYNTSPSKYQTIDQIQPQKPPFMAARSFCSLPNFTRRNPSHPTRSIELPHLFNLQNRNQRDNFSLKAWTESLPSSPINVKYLEREFSGHGASFEAIGDDCVIKMGLEEGSSANMVLPSGLITSYKPKMWHGGRVEVLHSLVSEDQNGEAVVQGGVSMDLTCVGDGGFAWSPTTWALLDVRGSSHKFIQVELISTSPNGKMKANCLVTLREDQLTSELTVTNSTPLFIKLQGGILTHLTVSTPDATYAVGLQGSNYCYKQARATEFSIIPPRDSAKVESSSAFFRSLAQKGFDGLFSGWGTKKHQDEEEEGEEKKECSDYVQMNEMFSRIYTSTPAEFTVIDRGRRNSVVIQKNGFEELYMFSPGSDHNWYGKYAFVCLGPCVLLKPVVLGPQGIWKGGQYLYNPNI